MSACCNNGFKMIHEVMGFKMWLGLIGPPGPQGPAGPPGSSVELRGPVATTSDLPATAPASELWQVGTQAPYNGYFFNGTSWVNLGPVAAGATFTPSVSAAGVISWTNDGGLPNPESVNIKGPQGETGSTGPAGPGVPAGGSAGQVLKKKSAADYDTAWEDDITVDSDLSNSSTNPVQNKAITTALAGKVNSSAVGAASGVASLDSSGKVPSAQLPSYVDDVINGYYYNGAFYEDAAHTTAITGETGKIYVDLASNKSYRWSGSEYYRIDEITVDSALSDSSTNPVQNKVVTAAIINSNDYNTRIAAYGGTDLSAVFEDATAFHAAVASGDFSKIHIGDYWPITLNGTYTDFARFTVPSGTTYYSDAELTTEVAVTESTYQGEYQSATAIKFNISGTNYYAAIGDCTAGWQKSMNAAVKMEVAAINLYLNMGNTSLTEQHILLCSRDCLPPTLQYRCSNSVWYDTTQVNPWRGSALWETLNNADNGIIKLLEATALGPYVFNGPHDKGMAAMLPSMAAGNANPTNSAWTDRGRLFLPTEREIYGANISASNGVHEAGNLYNKWPIFDGSARHIIKGAGDGGGRCLWWLESACGITPFAYVDSDGHAGGYSAGASVFRIPLCFLMT